MEIFFEAQQTACYNQQLCKVQMKGPGSSLFVQALCNGYILQQIPRTLVVLACSNPHQQLLNKHPQPRYQCTSHRAIGAAGG